MRMLFAVTTEDKPGMGATRRAMRQAHLDWEDKHRTMPVIAGRSWLPNARRTPCRA
jgi:uncharacterized protein YciI